MVLKVRDLLNFSPCFYLDAVRLVNGVNRCSGRGQVYHQGEWGSVCDEWDMTDAAVVCRELGCGDAVEAPRYAHFGQGSGRIWMSDVCCEGSEATLKHCGHWDRGCQNCGHHDDAGVICSGKQHMFCNYHI